MTTNGNNRLRKLSAGFSDALRMLLMSRSREERINAAIVSKSIFDEMSASSIAEEEGERQWRFFLAGRELEYKKNQRQFIARYGFLRNQSGYRVSKNICNHPEWLCYTYPGHYNIIIGEDDDEIELCPYEFTLIISRLNLILPDSLSIDMTGDIAHKIIERTRVRDGH